MRGRQRSRGGGRGAGAGADRGGYDRFGDAQRPGRYDYNGVEIEGGRTVPIEGRRNGSEQQLGRSPRQRQQQQQHISSDLLGFSYAPVAKAAAHSSGSNGGNDDGSSRGYRNRATSSAIGQHHRSRPLSRAQYVQANCTFNVEPGTLSSGGSGDSCNDIRTPLDVDEVVPWNCVRQVHVYGATDATCPICLGPPVAAKVTCCGHVFCWHCILHYLAICGGQSCPCPLCDDAVCTADLRSAICRVVRYSSPGDVVTFTKMRLPEGATVPVPVSLSKGYGKAYVGDMDGKAHDDDKKQNEQEQQQEQHQLEQQTVVSWLGEPRVAVMGAREYLFDVLQREENQLIEAMSAADADPFIEVALQQLNSLRRVIISALLKDAGQSDHLSLSTDTAVLRALLKRLDLPIHTLVLARRGGGGGGGGDFGANSTAEKELTTGSLQDPTAWPSLADKSSPTSGTTSDSDRGGSGSSVKTMMVSSVATTEATNTTSTSFPVGSSMIPISYISSRSPSAKGVSAAGTATHANTFATTSTIASTTAYSSSSPSFLFYQASNGSACFLHPINVRCLREENGGSLEDAPDFISARLLERENGVVSLADRARKPFLRFVPLHHEYSLCELDMRALVGPAAMSTVADQVKQRKTRRRRRDKADERRRQAFERSSIVLPAPSLPMTANIADHGQFPGRSDEKGLEEFLPQATAVDDSLLRDGSGGGTSTFLSAVVGGFSGSWEDEPTLAAASGGVYGSSSNSSSGRGGGGGGPVSKEPEAVPASRPGWVRSTVSSVALSKPKVDQRGDDPWQARSSHRKPSDGLNLSDLLASAATSKGVGKKGKRGVVLFSTSGGGSRP